VQPGGKGETYTVLLRKRKPGCQEEKKRAAFTHCREESNPHYKKPGTGAITPSKYGEGGIKREKGGAPRFE